MLGEKKVGVLNNRMGAGLSCVRVSGGELVGVGSQ